MYADRVTRILLSPLIRNATDRTPIRARLTALPSYPYHVDGPQVTFAQLLVWNFDEFTQPEITLEEPAVNTGWILALTVGATTVTRTVIFTGASVPWDQLTDVDPGTLAPLPSNEQLAAWTAVRDQILGALEVPDLTAYFENRTV